MRPLLLIDNARNKLTVYHGRTQKAVFEADAKVRRALTPADYEAVRVDDYDRPVVEKPVEDFTMSAILQSVVIH